MISEKIDRPEGRARDLLAEARRDVLHARRERLEVGLERRVQAGPAATLVSFLSLIWKFLYSSPFWRRPRPCTTASFSCPISCVCARTLSSGVKFAVLNVIWTPPLKSIPRFRPRVASEMTLIRTTAPEIANQSLRLAHVVDLEVLDHQDDAPMKRGFWNQRKPASRPSIARVAATAVISETTVPISSISAKPLTPAVATANRISAVIAVTTLASRIVRKPLRVAGGDRGAHGFTRARLLLDAFEDDDVRVCGHADREDQPSEAWQRERHPQQDDRRVHERAVDPEPDHGDETEEAVEQRAGTPRRGSDRRSRRSEPA